MSLILVILAALVGGWQGALFLTLCALAAKSVLEIVNYMEHYGIVRVPGQPVQPRHSWNSNKRMSSWTMFNLPRHSHHHAQGALPFEKLKPYPEAPKMITGYLATLFITLLPPLWQKLMQPKLEQWDNEYATAEEKLLIINKFY